MRLSRQWEQEVGVDCAESAAGGSHERSLFFFCFFFSLAQHMLLIMLQEKLTLLQAKERPLALTAAQFSSVSYITFEYSFEADDALNIPSGQNENVNRLNCVSKHISATW